MPEGRESQKVGLTGGGVTEGVSISLLIFANTAALTVNGAQPSLGLGGLGILKSHF